MKVLKKARLAAFFVLLPFFFSCENKDAPEGTVIIDKDTSYAIGMVFAEQYRFPVKVKYDYRAFMDGFRDFTEEQESRLSRDEAYEKIGVLIALINEEAGKAGREEAAEFLAMNAQRPEVIVTASGLQYEVITEGTGPKPGSNDMVEVHYQGSLLDGTVFDTSYGGEPALFFPGMLIEGWKEGLQLMGTGSVYKFYIPPEIGYGAQGAGSGAIPPNAVLIFTVELLGVEG